MWFLIILFIALSIPNAALPDNSLREISPSLLTNFDIFAQHSAAAGCEVNHNSDGGHPVYCDAGFCPLVNTTRNEVLHAFSRIHPGDTAGYIAVDHTNSLLIVSFRNTVTIANEFTDIQIPQVDASDICSECRAHMGFWRAATAIESDLKKPLVMSRIRYPLHRLIVTGHSLGGAIATLYAASLRESKVHVDLYTFGAPSVGNYALAEIMTNRESYGASYRVTHMNDEIPRILYRMSREPGMGVFPDYSQSGPEYWITCGNGAIVTVGDVQVLPGVDNEGGNLGTGLGNMRGHSWYMGTINVCAN